MAGIELYAPRTANQRRTWTWAVIVLSLTFLVVAQLIVVAPDMIRYAQAVHAHPELAKHHTPHSPALWELAVADGLLIMFILLWMRVFERRSPAAIGFNAKPLLRYLRGWLIGCGFLIAVVCGLWAMGIYTVAGPGVWQAPTLALLAPILGWVALFMVQGASEEVMMRGWLMQIVSSRHGLIWGVVINSLIFGALHLGNIKPSPELWAGASNVALFGIFISLYALKERSLWGVCAWHAAWNWLLGVGFGLEVSGLDMKIAPLVIKLKDADGAPWWLSGGSWGPEASIMTTGVLLIGIAFLVWKGALSSANGYSAPLLEVKAKPK